MASCNNNSTADCGNMQCTAQCGSLCTGTCDGPCTSNCGNTCTACAYNCYSYTATCSNCADNCSNHTVTCSNCADNCSNHTATCSGCADDCSYYTYVCSNCSDDCSGGCKTACVTSCKGQCDNGCVEECMANNNIHSILNLENLKLDKKIVIFQDDINLIINRINKELSRRNYSTTLTDVNKIEIIKKIIENFDKNLSQIDGYNLTIQNKDLILSEDFQNIINYLIDKYEDNLAR